jgi:hypothetical protein
MTDLTLEKWTELNTRLQEERDGLRKDLAAEARKLTRMAVIGLLLVFAGGAAIVIGSYVMLDNYVLLGAPMAVLVAMDVFFVLRVQRRMALLQSNIDRVDLDIRQWKRKKPGSIFTAGNH